MNRKPAPYYRDVQENKVLYRRAGYVSAGAVAFVVLLALVVLIMNCGGKK